MSPRFWMKTRHTPGELKSPAETHSITTANAAKTGPWAATDFTALPNLQAYKWMPSDIVPFAV